MFTVTPTVLPPGSDGPNSDGNIRLIADENVQSGESVVSVPIKVTFVISSIHAYFLRH